jgi:DNA (cytosine-5)-methyltransferase 1
MHVLLRQLGRHRGAPRLYLDTPALASAGLLPGSTLATELCPAEFRLTLRLNPAGSRRVSRKRRGAREVPVLDINTSTDLAPFEAFGETARCASSSTVVSSMCSCH